MDKKNILLTGATGFVGAHLLSELMRQDDISEIYLILRNVDKNIMVQNHEAIIPTLEKFNINFSKEKLKKVKIIYGNILEKKIGINSEVLYHGLSKKVDVIYHVAAEVHHLKTYEELKKANVDSIKEIIDFSINKKKKIINFISTMGAASKKDSNGKFVEDFPDNNKNDNSISMGYLKSKYEAEKLLSHPDYRNFVNIFRLGYISADTKNGIGLYESNQLMLFIKSCIQLGYAPNIERIINLTPVDFTSIIVGSHYFRNNAKHVMHLVNNREYITWLELVKFLNNEGFKINEIDLPSWQGHLKKSGRDNALYRMLLTYRRPDADNHIIKFGKNINEYNIDNVALFCKQENLSMPKIKYDYLRKIFNHLLKIGFLTKNGIMTK